MNASSHWMFSTRQNLSSEWEPIYVYGYLDGAVPPIDSDFPRWQIQPDGNIAILDDYVAPNLFSLHWIQSTGIGYGGQPPFYIVVHNDGYAYMLDRDFNYAGWTIPNDPNVTYLYPASTLTPEPTAVTMSPTMSPTREILAHSNACFHAQLSNQSTIFNAPVNGHLTGIKLVYINGSVTCVDNFDQSTWVKWGCYDPFYLNFIHVTDASNHIGEAYYPQTNTAGFSLTGSGTYYSECDVDACGYHQYLLENQTANDTEMTWVGPSYNITTDDLFMLQYSEACCSYGVDNHGTTCADVYFLYDEYYTVSPTTDPSNDPTQEPTTMPTNAPTSYFQLILNHKDVSNGFFNGTLRTTGYENEGKPFANTYSIIGGLTNNSVLRKSYEDQDGKYTFKLIYKYESDPDDIIIWRQSSWITEQNIIGADLYDIPQQLYTSDDRRYFNGLGLNIGDSHNISYLDGDGDISGYIWNSVGTLAPWGSNDDISIPAFNGKTAYGQSLYIYQPQPRSYYFVSVPENEKLNWFQAQEYCQDNYGTNLATVTTRRDFELAVNIMNESGDPYVPTWIGLNDINKEGVWRWASNSPCDSTANITKCVTYWKAGEPNNWPQDEDCADIIVDSSTDIPHAGDGPCISYQRTQWLCDVLLTNNPTTEPTIDPTNDPSMDPTKDPTRQPSVDPTNKPSKDPSLSPSISPTLSPTSANARDVEVVITFKYTVTDGSNVTIDSLIDYFKNITGDALSEFIDQDDVECDQEIAHINITVDKNSTAEIKAIITVCDEDTQKNLATKLEVDAEDLSKDIIETANNDESPIDVDEDHEIIVTVRAVGLKEEDDGINYARLYVTIALIIAGAGLFISIIGYFHANYYRINDYYTPNAILIAIFQILDLLSDIFLAIIISEQINDSEHIYLILFICVLIFIIVPISVSFGQLLKQISKHWWKNDNIKSWLISYSKILYLLSLFTGSSFTAIKVMNSNLFGLNIFSMDLSKNDLTRYQTKRVYSIVLIENLPQVIIQCIYLLQIDKLDLIAISSMIFSIISIIVTIISMLTEKKILNSAGHGNAKFDVTGSMILSKAHHYRNKTKRIRNSISSVLGLESELIEIERPKKNTIRIKYINEYSFKSYSISEDKL